VLQVLAALAALHQVASTEQLSRTTKHKAQSTKGNILGQSAPLLDGSRDGGCIDGWCSCCWRRLHGGRQPHAHARQMRAAAGSSQCCVLRACNNEVWYVVQ
jgi:hypothetical protein